MQMSPDEFIELFGERRSNAGLRESLVTVDLSPAREMRAVPWALLDLAGVSIV
jgi:hypothetical protein